MQFTVTYDPVSRNFHVFVPRLMATLCFVSADEVADFIAADTGGLRYSARPALTWPTDYVTPSRVDGGGNADK